MSLLKVIALVMAVLSALTMLGVAYTIRRQFREQPDLETAGAKFAQWLHLFWSVTVTVLAGLVVYG